MYVYFYTINSWTAAVSLFQSSSTQLRSNEYVEWPEYQSTKTTARVVIYHKHMYVCIILTLSVNFIFTF